MRLCQREGRTTSAGIELDQERRALEKSEQGPERRIESTKLGLGLRRKSSAGVDS